MFQVLTGDSWSEAIGRPLVANFGPFGTGFFFVSFNLVNAIVLVNVVVAELLEKMVEEEPEDEHHAFFAAAAEGPPRVAPSDDLDDSRAGADAAAEHDALCKRVANVGADGRRVEGSFDGSSSRRVGWSPRHNFDAESQNSPLPPLRPPAKKSVGGNPSTTLLLELLRQNAEVQRTQQLILKKLANIEVRLGRSDGHHRH
mmetsp:Transcript_21204/g.73163  ORF Transcript_21204/g.73163 Transcript_21204/m.73163 type:complete len:200 (+) Transcript_21204:282-881(+)